jgi:chromosomal replication initiation ATPase DnaA
MRDLSFSIKGRPTMALIKQFVAREFGISVMTIESRRRTDDAHRARQAAVYLALKLTAHSTTVIGRELGGRDHTTVMHARDSLACRLAREPELEARLDALERRIAEEFDSVQALEDAVDGTMTALQREVARLARAAAIRCPGRAAEAVIVALRRVLAEAGWEETDATEGAAGATEGAAATTKEEDQGQ